MNPVSKFLIVAGGALILCGLLWHFGGRFLSLGRLPGDFSYERQNVRIYFPLGTSILLSVILSVILGLFRHFGG